MHNFKVCWYHSDCCYGRLNQNDMWISYTTWYLCVLNLKKNYWFWIYGSTFLQLHWLYSSFPAECCIVAVPCTKKDYDLSRWGATTSATIQCPAETLILLGGLFQRPFTCQPIVNVRYLAQMSGASRVKPRDRWVRCSIISADIETV